MPHDMKGQKIEAGDRVLIPVSPVRYMQVIGNEAAPDEYCPTLLVHDGVEQTLEALVVQVYEGEDACNAEFEVVGMSGTTTFNTRLVEKLVPATVE